MYPTSSSANSKLKWHLTIEIIAFDTVILILNVNNGLKRYVVKVNRVSSSDESMMSRDYLSSTHALVLNNSLMSIRSMSVTRAHHTV